MHDPMVTRLLDSSDGRIFEVLVGRPVDTGKGDFACHYQIKGKEYVLNSYSVGEDSVQALMLTLRSIGSQLNLIQETENLKIYWLDEQSSHGFPLI